MRERNRRVSELFLKQTKINMELFVGMRQRDSLWSQCRIRQRSLAGVELRKLLAELAAQGLISAQHLPATKTGRIFVARNCLEIRSKALPRDKQCFPERQWKLKMARDHLRQQTERAIDQGRIMFTTRTRRLARNR
jgi:hypothetical protein